MTAHSIAASLLSASCLTGAFIDNINPDSGTLVDFFVIVGQSNAEGRVVIAIDGTLVSTGSPFRIEGIGDVWTFRPIRPISIGNDYVWCKTSGGNLGVNLKLGMSDPDPVVYLWPMDDHQVSAAVPDLLSGKLTKTEVSRIGGVWSLLIDDVVVSSANTDVTYWVGDWDGGTEFLGFIIGGVANNDGYSGRIDMFSVYTK